MEVSRSFHKRRERNRECYDPWIDDRSRYAHAFPTWRSVRPNGRILAPDGGEGPGGSGMFRILREGV
jgi:hypothetical protein